MGGGETLHLFGGFPGRTGPPRPFKIDDCRSVEKSYVKNLGEPCVEGFGIWLKVCRFRGLGDVPWLKGAAAALWDTGDALESSKKAVGFAPHLFEWF